MTGRGVQSSTLQFIREREGLRFSAYKDTGGTATVGYGATFYENQRRVQIGETISRERAEQLLLFHANYFAGAVNRLVTKQLTQNQFDALVSFTFNLGEGSFGRSTLLRVINSEPDNIYKIRAAFLLWPLPKRRELEAALYASNVAKSGTVNNQSAIVQTAFGVAAIALLATIYQKMK